MTAILFCLTLLISPSAIIGIGLLGMAWMAIIRATSEGSMQVKGKKMGRGGEVLGENGRILMTFIFIYSMLCSCLYTS